jgi:hypothetical protein
MRVKTRKKPRNGRRENKEKNRSRGVDNQFLNANLIYPVSGYMV